MLWQTYAAGLSAAALLIAGSFLLVPGADEPALDAEPAPAATTFTPTSEPVRFEDARGDAVDVSFETGLAAADGLARTAATDAPYMDITAFAYEGETADALTFSLEIASISEGFSELSAPPTVHRMVTYELCWMPDEAHGCDRGARLDVMRHGDEAHVASRLDIRNSECNEWRWCSYDIDHEITFGSPATIRFTVPKAFATADGAEPGIHHLDASTWGWTESTAFPMWHPGITAHTPVYHLHTHGGSVGAPSLGDWSDEPGLTDQAYVPYDERPHHPDDAPLLTGMAGLGHGAGGPYDHPEMDLLWFDAYEEHGELVSVFAVSEYHGTPDYDFDYSVGIGLGEFVYEIGYRHEGDETYGYAGRCIMESCQDGFHDEAEVTIVEGSPAFVEVRTPLETIGSPEPGTATNLFWAMTMVSDVNYYWGEQGGELYGDYHSVFMVDALYGGAPYVFGSEHRAAYQVHEGHPKG